MGFRRLLLGVALLYSTVFTGNACQHERIVNENNIVSEELASRYRFENGPSRDFRIQLRDPSQNGCSVLNPVYIPVSLHEYELLVDNFIEYRTRMMILEITHKKLIEDRVRIPMYIRADD